MHLITAAYPLIVAATQAPTEEEPRPPLSRFKDLARSDQPIKKPLGTRNIGLPYQWNPEKRELKSSVEGLRLFCDQKVSLVDGVESLILENPSRQASSLEDKLLEPFGHLSQLTLKGPFKNLAFLTLVKHKFNHLVLWNTRLPFQEISFLIHSIPLKSLDLGRNAFLKPGKHKLIQGLFFENLKNLKLDASMSWLLNSLSGEALTSLEVLSLRLNALNDRELQLFTQCKQLKTLNLSVRHMIVLTYAPIQPSSITTLGLDVDAFINSESFQSFLAYFPHVKTLRLEGSCQHVSIDEGILNSFRHLQFLHLGEQARLGLQVDQKLLKERRIILTHSLRSRL